MFETTSYSAVGLMYVCASWWWFYRAIAPDMMRAYLVYTCSIFMSYSCYILHLSSLLLWRMMVLSHLVHSATSAHDEMRNRDSFRPLMRCIC